jgi:hypothetical protein
MKTHRPWQPQMRNSPLFNTFAPTGSATTLDHFDLVEDEEADETEDEAENPSSPRNED